MKKTSLFIMIIFILTILAACTQNKVPAKEPDKAAANKSEMELTPIQIPTNAEIVFFNNQKLYYYTDKFDTKTSEHANKTLNEYDFNSKTSKALFSVPDIITYSASFALKNSDIYLPFSTNNVETILVKADMEKGSTEIIKKWKTFPPFAFVYTLNNNLILYGPNEVGETTEYYVNKINLDTNKEENIIKKKRKNLIGELIPCIDVDDKYIYTFSIKVDKNSENYKISQYDSDGKLLKNYPFNLKFYLDSATLRGQDDAISDFYKKKDHFILETLGGRVFVFKIINNKMQPVKLPEKIYKENPSGFRFIKYFDGNSDFAYFANPFKENNIITVFNYSTEKLTKLEFPKNKGACFYSKNASGDLIMKKPKEQNTSEFDYFYYKNPDK